MLRLQQHSPSPPESTTWGANYQNYYWKSWVGDGGFRQSSLPNRLTTLLIPQLNSHRSPLTEARPLLWSRSRAECSPPVDRQRWRKWGWAKHTHFLLPNSQITGLSLSQEEREYTQCHEKGQEDFSTWNHEMWNWVFPLIKVTLQKRGSCWCATAIVMNLTIPPNITPYIPIYLAITEAMESQAIPQLSTPCNSVELRGSAIYPAHIKTLDFQSNHLPSAKCLLS